LHRCFNDLEFPTQGAVLALGIPRRALFGNHSFCACQPLCQHLTAPRLCGQTTLEVRDQLVQHAIVTWRGRLGGDLPGQCPPQFLDGRIPGDDSLAEGDLLLVQARPQFGVLLLELA
jgi:hypothetical protein